MKHLQVVVFLATDFGNTKVQLLIIYVLEKEPKLLDISHKKLISI